MLEILFWWGMKKISLKNLIKTVDSEEIITAGGHKNFSHKFILSIGRRRKFSVQNKV